MPYDPVRQALADDEHLRLLTIGYYISAGISAAYSLLGIFYALMGGMMGLAISHSAVSAAARAGQSNDAAPQIIGGLFALVGVAIFLSLIAIAALKFYVARCLEQRKSRTFCFVIAILSCLGVPYGTVLGIFTILVLERPTVKRLFDANVFPPPSAPPFVPTVADSPAPPRV